MFSTPIDELMSRPVYLMHKHRGRFRARTRANGAAAQLAFWGREDYDKDQVPGSSRLGFATVRISIMRDCRGSSEKPVHPRKVIEHGGGIEGFTTMLPYYPEDKLTVAALSKFNGPSPPDLASKLAALAHGEKVVLPSERKEVPLDPKVLDGYVGNYELAPKFILTVTREGERLITQATGQPKVPIFAESERGFFAKVVDAQITFVPDAQGRATELILHQGGRDMHAKRFEGEVPQPKPCKETTLDPKVFDGYVGQYQLAPDFILTVGREGDALFAQATGQPKAQIFPEGERGVLLQSRRCPNHI